MYLKLLAALDGMDSKEDKENWARLGDCVGSSNLGERSRKLSPLVDEPDLDITATDIRSRAPDSFGRLSGL